MKLYEVDTEDEMIAALKAGDQELLSDLEKEVERAVYGAWSHATYDTEDLDDEQLFAQIDSGTGATWGDILEALIEKSPVDVDYVAERVPEERLYEAIRDELAGITDHGATPHGGLFVLADDREGYGHTELKPIYADLYVNFTDQLAWVPEETMAKLLDRALTADWEDLGDNSWSSGWVETPESLWLVVTSGDRAYEFLLDQHRAWLDHLLENHREQANKMFLGEIRAVDPTLHKKFKKAKLPSDVLGSYALVWFEAGEDPDERAEALIVLREAMGIFGYEGSRAEVIVEIDRDTLRSLGITEGKWWDPAPWRLVNLPPEELSYEGTIQRHCVGRHDMGYREAVERGETQIWSLRSAFNKPVLTWEIDLNRWRRADPEDARYDPRVTDLAAERGLAVAQLKGFRNRISATTPQEALVLGWLFRHLGIDPRYVRDVSPNFGLILRGPQPGPQDNPGGFDAPWLPYDVRAAKARCLKY